MPASPSRLSMTIARRCDAFCTDRILHGRFCLSKHTENGDLGSPAPRSALCLRSSPCGGLLPLRVFGCLPGAGARGCTEAGVRKASREATAGEFAPTLVSIYGDLGAVYAVIFRFSNTDDGWVITAALVLVAVCRIGRVVLS